MGSRAKALGAGPLPAPVKGWGGLSPAPSLAARTPPQAFQINCLANLRTFCSLRSFWGERADLGVIQTGENRQTRMTRAGVASDFTLRVGRQPVSLRLLCGLLVSSLGQSLS